MKHTATPYHYKGDAVAYNIKPENGSTVAMCAEEANAAFIVKACNTHDELVLQAKAVLAVYTHQISGSDVLQQLEKAIAKAEE